MAAAQDELREPLHQPLWIAAIRALSLHDLGHAGALPVPSEQGRQQLDGHGAGHRMLALGAAPRDAAPGGPTYKIDVECNTSKTYYIYMRMI